MEDKEIPQKGEAPDEQSQKEIEDFLKNTPEGQSIGEKEEQEAEADTPSGRFGPEVPYGLSTEEDATMQEAMYLPDIPDPTEEQKEAYIKAVLMDEPFELELKSMGGQFKIKFRSRNQRVQTDIVRNIRIGMLVKDIPDDNPLVNLAYVQYFNLLHSVETINGKPLVQNTPPESPLYLPGVHSSMTEDELKGDPNYAWYMNNTRKIIMGMQQIRLQHIITQAKIFEGLCAKLATEITKPNFSDPQDEQH